WKLLIRDVAASFDSAVHRVHAVFFDAAVVSTVSAGYIVLLLLVTLCSFLLIMFDLEAVPADYVPAGHVLISADRYRIC
ncbi:hypothetical protein Tco_1145577, partial [Tanacetum coccineum]